MKKKKNHIAVYPGEYKPRVVLKEIAEKLNNELTEPITEARANVTELKDSYRIEMVVPGVSNEDFYISAKDNRISVTALQGSHEHGEENFKLHEFDKECFHRHILLPKEVDPRFITAEYQNGILFIHVPKNGYDIGKNAVRVIVY